MGKRGERPRAVYQSSSKGSAVFLAVWVAVGNPYLPHLDLQFFVYKMRGLEPRHLSRVRESFEPNVLSGLLQDFSEPFIC